MCDSTKDHFYPSPLKICQSMWIQWLFLSKNLNQRSLTPRWPLTPSLLRSHVWLYPRIIVSNPMKIHQNMWIQWPFFPKTCNQRSLTPRWPLTPHLMGSHVWLNPRIIVSKSHGNTSMYVDTVINFAKYHIHTMYILRTEWVISFWTKFRRDKNQYQTILIPECPIGHCTVYLLKLTSKNRKCRPWLKCSWGVWFSAHLNWVKLYTTRNKIHTYSRPEYPEKCYFQHSRHF